MTEISDDERIDWLRLARTEAVGAVTFFHLINRFGSAKQALAALPAMAARGGRANLPDIPGREVAERELAAGAALGARMVAACEPSFPRLLSVLDPPPPLLWIKGEVAQLSRPCIAIVGARSASTAGRRFARQLAAGLGEAGWVVVSGLARGIDAAAHEGSLATGAVAALAGGVDDVYPPEHRDLYNALCAEGCVISERAVGHNARARDFPRRNRIISGLAMGVVVVEAELRSGSLITARLAGEQGREVFAVPGSPLDPRNRGTNDLLRQGATLVEEPEDILRVLEPLRGFAAPDAPVFSSTTSTDETEINDARRRLAPLLSPTPVSVDELARSVNLPISQVLAALVELSLAECAELLPGGFVAAL